MPGIIGVPNPGGSSYTLGGRPHGSIWGGGLAFYTAVAGDSINIIEFHGNILASPLANMTMAVYTVVAGFPSAQVHAPVSITPLGGGAAWWSITGLAIALTAGVTYCICGIMIRSLRCSSFNSGNGSSSYFGLGLTNPWVHSFYQGRVLSMRAIVIGPAVGNQDHRRGYRPTT